MILNPKLFILPLDEIKKIGQTNLVYGSLTNNGLIKMINIIKKYMYNNISNIYGLDLGCGDGELIYNLEQLLPESKWDGVEISEHRIDLKTREVNIWQGDMLDENFRDYNILHADNLCLDDDIAEKLENKITIEFSGIYITYRKPQSMKFIKKSIYLDTVMIETTWINHPIHFYKI